VRESISVIDMPPALPPTPATHSDRPESAIKIEALFAQILKTTRINPQVFKPNPARGPWELRLTGSYFI